MGEVGKSRMSDGKKKRKAVERRVDDDDDDDDEVVEEYKPQRYEKKSRLNVNAVKEDVEDNDDDDDDEENLSDDDLQSIDNNTSDEDSLHDDDASVAVVVQGRDDVGKSSGNLRYKNDDSNNNNNNNKKHLEKEEERGIEAVDADIIEAIQNGIDEFTIALRLMRRDAPSVETKTRKISRNNEKNEHLREVQETNRLWYLLTLVKQRYYRTKARELIETYTAVRPKETDEVVRRRGSSSSQRRDAITDKAAGKKHVADATSGKKVKWVDTVLPGVISSTTEKPSSSGGRSSSSSSSSGSRDKEGARSASSRPNRKSSVATAAAIPLSLSGLPIAEHRLLQMAYSVEAQPTVGNDKSSDAVTENRSKRSRTSSNKAAILEEEAAAASSRDKSLSIILKHPGSSTRQLRRDRSGSVADVMPAVSQYCIRVGESYQAVVSEWDDQMAQLQQHRRGPPSTSTYNSLSDEPAYRPLYDEECIENYLLKALQLASSLREDVQRVEANVPSNATVLCVVANNAEDVCLDFFHKK